MDNNMTQSDVALKINISRGSYSKYEIEDDIIPLKHLIAISNLFNVSLDYIFNFSDNKIYSNYNTNIDAKIVGNRLKNFRKENKITQTQLAELLGTVHPTITNYENGKHLIATPFLYEICKKYKISADYLLGKIDEPKYLK